MTKKIAIKWLKQALHDLEMAEKNISIEGYDVAAFLAHQAVEKLFKSLIALKGKKIPKIHYIDELANQLELNDEIINAIKDLIIDYTFARYPDVAEHVPYEEYTEEISIEKIKIAKDIFSSLKKIYEPLLRDNDE